MPKFSGSFNIKQHWSTPLTAKPPTKTTDIDALISPDRWMSKVLLGAAAYNLVWGSVAILAPNAMFRLFGFSPMPLYPEFWQCIGMIVGVYGVGYAIAAYHPYRHWPIVLVGLLGKVLGPLGFCNALLTGRLPAVMGWTILTNDLIWWIPFSIILWRAMRASQCETQQFKISAPSLPLNPLGRVFSQLGSTLTDLSCQTPVLVIFLRHSGCTFCREALSDIAAVRHQVEAGGTKIAFVHMGHQEPEELLAQHELQDVHCFRDRSCSLYETFGLQLGSPVQLFGPYVWWRAVGAFLNGHRLGPLNGNGFRMPGVFLLYKGQILRAFRHATAADRPDYVELSELPDQSDAIYQSDQMTSGANVGV
jgi:hypothetical protein